MSWKAPLAAVLSVLALSWAACAGSSSGGAGGAGGLPFCEGTITICRSDADCPSGLPCTAADVCGCAFPCITDADCVTLGNEVCGPGGVCALALGACRSNADCDGGLCELGACRFGPGCVCTSDAQCDTAHGEVCDTSIGLCVQGAGTGGAGTGGMGGAGAGGQAGAGGAGGDGGV